MIEHMGLSEQGRARPVPLPPLGDKLGMGCLAPKGGLGREEGMGARAGKQSKEWPALKPPPLALLGCVQKTAHGLRGTAGEESIEAQADEYLPPPAQRQPPEQVAHPARVTCTPRCTWTWSQAVTPTEMIVIIIMSCISESVRTLQGDCAFFNLLFSTSLYKYLRLLWRGAVLPSVVPASSLHSHNKSVRLGLFFPILQMRMVAGNRNLRMLS